MDIDTPIVELGEVGSASVEGPSLEHLERPRDPVQWQRQAAMRYACPKRYEGQENVDIIEDFALSIRRFMPFTGCSGTDSVAMAACFLDGKALRWWDSLCVGENHQLPPEINTLDAFFAKLAARFLPQGMSEAATLQLQQLRQEKLRPAQYVEKFQTLVRRIPTLSEEVQLHLFLNGLTPIQRMFVTTAFASEGKPMQLLAVIAFVRKLEGSNPQGCSGAFRADYAAPTPETTGPEPMDIGHVTTTGAGNKPQYHGRKQNQHPTQGATRGNNGPRFTGACLFCDIPGHKIRDCRKLKALREQHGISPPQGNGPASSHNPQQ